MIEINEKSDIMDEKKGEGVNRPQTGPRGKMKGGRSPTSIKRSDFMRRGHKARVKACGGRKEKGSIVHKHWREKPHP